MYPLALSYVIFFILSVPCLLALQSKIAFFAAYGSSRHITLYSELGLQHDQIFIHCKRGDRKTSNHKTTSGKKKEELCQVCLGRPIV